MFYLQINALYNTVKIIVLSSFLRHELKLSSNCCVSKVHQYKIAVKRQLLTAEANILATCKQIFYLFVTIIVVI